MLDNALPSLREWPRQASLSPTIHRLTWPIAFVPTSLSISEVLLYPCTLSFEPGSSPLSLALERVPLVSIAVTTICRGGMIGSEGRRYISGILRYILDRNPCQLQCVSF